MITYIDGLMVEVRHFTKEELVEIDKIFPHPDGLIEPGIYTRDIDPKEGPMAPVGPYKTVDEAMAVFKKENAVLFAPVNVLGYEFKSMTKEDWWSFSGAEPGTLICYAKEGLTLLWDRSNGILSEIYTAEGKQRDWKYTEIC